MAVQRGFCAPTSAYVKYVSGARWAVVTMAAMMAMALLGGCATMSPEQCLTADWSQRGYKDGHAGFTSNRLSKHYKACSQVGVTPNVTAYRKGYDEGLMQYCTPGNAVVEGRAGKPYRNVCPARLENRFLYYYDQGKRIYDAEEQVDRLVRESRRLEARLDDADSRHESRHLRRELRDMDYDLRRARENLTDEQRQLDRMSW